MASWNDTTTALSYVDLPNSKKAEAIFHSARKKQFLLASFANLATHIGLGVFGFQSLGLSFESALAFSSMKEEGFVALFWIAAIALIALASIMYVWDEKGRSVTPGLPKRKTSSAAFCMNFALVLLLFHLAQHVEFIRSADQQIKLAVLFVGVTALYAVEAPLRWLACWPGKLIGLIVEPAIIARANRKLVGLGPQWKDAGGHALVKLTKKGVEFSMTAYWLRIFVAHPSFRSEGQAHERGFAKLNLGEWESNFFKENVCLGQEVAARKNKPISQETYASNPLYFAQLGMHELNENPGSLTKSVLGQYALKPWGPITN